MTPLLSLVALLQSPIDDPFAPRSTPAGFGCSVEVAGDVDHDGFQDWIINDSFPNECWVISGREDRILFAIAPDEDQGYWIRLGAAGDVDLDGCADIYWCGGTEDGAWTRVLSGEDGSVVQEFPGHALARLGDVDKDGCADFAAAIVHLDLAARRKSYTIEIRSGKNASVLYSVGTGRFDDRGRIAVRRAGDVDLDAYPDWLLLAGDLATLRSGRDGRVIHSFGPWDRVPPGSIGAGADFDGDGCPDVVVGYPQRASSRKSRANVRIYSSVNGSLIAKLKEGFACFGDDVACTRDLDGDRHDDLIVAAHGPHKDAVLVYSGLDRHVIHRFEPEETDVRHRYCVRSLPDIDRDGVSDILLGITPFDGDADADGYVQVRSGRTGEILRRYDRDRMLDMPHKVLRVGAMELVATQTAERER